MTPEREIIFCLYNIYIIVDIISYAQQSSKNYITYNRVTLLNFNIFYFMVCIVLNKKSDKDIMADVKLFIIL